MGQCQTQIPTLASASSPFEINTEKPVLSKTQQILQQQVQASMPGVSPSQPSVFKSRLSQLDVWKLHKPLEVYAIKVDQQAINFEIPDAVFNTIQSLGQPIINCQLEQTEGYNTDDIYFIHSLKALYKGQWYHSKITGLGLLLFENGNIYQGQLLNSNPHGSGRYIYKDGSYYEGTFNEGKYDGFGTLHKIDGFIYEGDWKNGKPHGQGSESWPDGTTFSGQFQIGIKQGNGIFTYENGKESYTGDLEKNEFHGQGLYKWENGNTYEGEWKNGCRDGEGVFTYSNGKTYKGTFKNNLEHGQGTVTYPNSVVQKGTWIKGKLEGEVFVFIKGNVYRGIWRQGKRSKWQQVQKSDNQNVTLEELDKLFDDN